MLAEQKKMQSMEMPEFPLALQKPAEVSDLDAQEAFFRENSEQLKEQLKTHGAIHLRGFDLCKEPEGFERMYKALGLDACLDPLHSVAGRPVVSGKQASSLPVLDSPPSPAPRLQ